MQVGLIWVGDMGGCCSKDVDKQGIKENDSVVHRRKNEVEEADDNEVVGVNGLIVRFHGSSKFTSMFTQQGRKGINQDSLIVCEVPSLLFFFSTLSLKFYKQF